MLRSNDQNGLNDERDTTVDWSTVNGDLHRAQESLAIEGCTLVKPTAQRILETAKAHRQGLPYWDDGTKERMATSGDITPFACPSQSLPVELATGRLSYRSVFDRIACS